MKISCQSKQYNRQDTNKMRKKFQEPFSRKCKIFTSKNFKKLTKNLKVYCDISLKSTTKELFFVLRKFWKDEKKHFWKRSEKNKLKIFVNFFSQKLKRILQFPQYKIKIYKQGFSTIFFKSIDKKIKAPKQKQKKSNCFSTPFHFTQISWNSQNHVD